MAAFQLSQTVNRAIFMENCSGHYETSAVIVVSNEINVDKRKLPTSSTILFQTLGCFAINIFKQVCRSMDSIKRRMIGANFSL